MGVTFSKRHALHGVLRRHERFCVLRLVLRAQRHVGDVTPMRYARKTAREER